LPDGATRTDHRFRQLLFDYAQENATSWYQHVIGTLGLDAVNGSLYLVTGVDKTSNWCIASYSDAPEDPGITLKPIAASTVTSSATSQYSWEISGPVDARTCSAIREGRSMNQCVFVRGCKLALSERLYQRLYRNFVLIPSPTPELISQSPLVDASLKASCIRPPQNVDRLGNIERPSDTYSRILLAKGIGYPLWIPEPSSKYPAGYRNKGASIGDVGVITSDGHFDFIFNVFSPCDHPINNIGVPPGFLPLPQIRTEDVITTPDIYSPGCVIGSTSIRRRIFNLDDQLHRDG
jgi:hypothetical protein